MLKEVKNLFVSIALVLCISCVGYTRVTILVNPGPFKSIDEAATAEKKVNWADNDFSDDRACTECFAAKELADFLVKSKATDKNHIKIQKPGKFPKKGAVFLLGSKKSNPIIKKLKINETTALETSQSFRIVAFQKNGRTTTIIEGKDRIGTLYGVYRYLELLGFRFYGLGEMGTVYPDAQLELPKSIEIAENPSFLSRGYCATEQGGNKDFFLWMARNRMNYWPVSDQWMHFLKKLGVKLTKGGHHLQYEFLNPHAQYPYNHPKFKGDEDKPKDPYALGGEYIGDVNNDGTLTYFEAHPEWYGLRDGKRSDNVGEDFGDNYCTSNEDAGKELAKNLVQALINGDWRYLDILDFWMLDVGKWCECGNCKKQGSHTDKLMGVANIMLKEIRQALTDGRLARQIELGVPAYVETISPPTRPLPDDFSYKNFFVTFFPIERCYAHTFSDPACTEVNSSLRDSYLGWVNGEHFKGSMLIGEYYNVSSHVTMPLVFSKILAADIPWYYQTGARHLNYMHTPMRRWGTWTLNQRLLAELLWNTQTDVDNFLNDYFTKYYPTTTTHTRKFYQHLEEALANVKAFKHGVSNTKGHYGYTLRSRLADKDLPQLFPMEHLHYESFHPVLNDGPDIVDMVEGMRKAQKEIDTALMECKNEKEKQRLLEDQRRFAYGQAIVNFYYRIIRTAIFHRRGDQALAKNEFKYVDRIAKKLESITDLVHVSASTGADAENGLKAALHWPTGVNPYEFFKEKYGNNIDPNN